MLRNRLLSACLLLSLLAFAPAFARDCPKGKPWQCFTEVTFEQDNFKLHLIVFGNDDMMGEIERDGRLRRIIFIGPNRPSLYAGLTPEEMQRVTPLPFIVPVPKIAQLLDDAFPGGPASVPLTPKAFSSNGEKITASRDAAGVIHYTVDSYDLGKASGIFSTRKVLPLSDDYPVSEWTLADGRHLKRLGELRSGVSSEPQPPTPPLPQLRLKPQGPSTYRVVPAPAPDMAAVRAQARPAMPAAGSNPPASR